MSWWESAFFYVVAQAFGKRYLEFPINTHAWEMSVDRCCQVGRRVQNHPKCRARPGEDGTVPGTQSGAEDHGRGRHPVGIWGTMVTVGDQIVTPTPPWLGQFWLQFGWNMRWINGCLGRWNRPHLSGQVSPKDLVAGKIKSLAFSAPTRCRWIGSGAGVICRLNFLKWNELIRSNSNWLGPMMVGTRGCSFHFLTLHRTILGCCGWSQDWWSDPCGSHHGRDASLSWVGVNTDGP